KTSPSRRAPEVWKRRKRFSLAADLDKLTIQQVFEDKIYKKDADGNYVLGEDGSKVLTGTWKYLLVKDGKEQECQIKEIDSLVSNMTANMQSATLNDLSDDKILTLDEAFRRKNIKYDFGPSKNRALFQCPRPRKNDDRRTDHHRACRLCRKTSR
ncbi:MAG: hypothetical protein ACLS4Z_11405, partial [Christensenellaceae bacterium]